MDARILLVDDDPTFLDFAEPMVKAIVDDAIQVQVATGPKEALRVLDAWVVGGVSGLVITDYIMPEMTGMDLIRAARELHPNGHLQYACLTTVFHTTVLARTKQAGAIRAEVKTTDMGELEETFRSIIRPWREALDDD